MKNEFDEHAARELGLYIDNDTKLYHQKTLPIQKNLLRKIKSGKYDHSKAPKLWQYLVDEGARRYRQDFGDTFTTATRHGLAKKYANEFYKMVKAGEFSILASTL